MPADMETLTHERPGRRWPRRLAYHAVTLVGFAVIDWAFQTRFNLLEAIAFLAGLEVIGAGERFVSGRKDL